VGEKNIKFKKEIYYLFCGVSAGFLKGFIDKGQEYDKINLQRREKKERC